MINHIWSVLCKKSIIDRDTNNFSIIDVLEQLSIETSKDNPDKNSKISLPIEYEVVSFWTKNVEHENAHYKGQIKVEILNPSGEKEKTFEQVLDMPKEVKRMRTRLKINGLVVEQPGVYVFAISYKNEDKSQYKKVATIPLEVIIHKK